MVKIMVAMQQTGMKGGVIMMETKENLLRSWWFPSLMGRALATKTKQICKVLHQESPGVVALHQASSTSASSGLVQLFGWTGLCVR